MTSISFKGVKTHNLKNIDIELEPRKFYVVTGVSGSGKSSLAFDTLYAEGQRRYIESLSSYSRQFLSRMPKPDVKAVSGILPSIAIQSKNAVNNARSTVGTQTEIYDFLRVFFSRLGVQYCSNPKCKNQEIRSFNSDQLSKHILKIHEGEKCDVFFTIPISKAGKKHLNSFLGELEKKGFEKIYDEKKGWVDIDDIEALAKIDDEIKVLVDQIQIKATKKRRLVEAFDLAFEFGRGEVGILIGKEFEWFSKLRICSKCKKKHPSLTAHFFSFNSPSGACDECQGFGRIITIDWGLVIPDEDKPLKDGAIEPWTKESTQWDFGELMSFCRRKKIPTTKSWKQLTKKQKKWIIEGVEGDDYMGIEGFFAYLQKRSYKMHVRIFMNRYRGYIVCPTCEGKRLKPEVLNVFVKNKNISDILNMNIESLLDFFKGLKLSKSSMEKVESVYDEILGRLQFLSDVGLEYMTLARLSRTLSGGEMERIHLASSLGSALVDTLYVLDEPSIGLHERDNQMLIGLLRKLRDLGNTVVVVEHDRSMIEAADQVIDLGPCGGENGGNLIFQGGISELRDCEESVTGDYLSGRKQICGTLERDKKSSQKIILQGATAHNLKGCDIEVPLNKLVVISGVSGSGKSTLIYHTLYNQYKKYKGRPIAHDELGEVKKITGFKNIDDIVSVDQTPIGKSPRSNSATYMKVYDDIRKIFARTSEAKKKKLKPGDFSFNVDGGRCDVCKGDGQIKVEMHFLADVFMTCDACQGKRFKKKVLRINYRGKNIDDILSLTITEAIQFFQNEKKLVSKLNILEDVGLGYLRLGQPTLTLSGGEGQRLKLASELASSKDGRILYLFDEPTTGLHEADIQFLVQAFEKLLEKGHSVICVEHHMELIKLADTIIDLGPEGGEKGGEVIYEGAISGLLKNKKSWTGRCLDEYLSKKKGLIKQGA